MAEDPELGEELEPLRVCPFDRDVIVDELEDSQPSQYLLGYLEHLKAFDAVLDVTELSRKPYQSSILALVAPSVPVRSALHAGLEDLAQNFRCPLLVAPASNG